MIITIYGKTKLSLKKELEEKEKYELNYKYSDKYFGYIEIPKYKRLLMIYNGDVNKIVDEEKVGVFLEDEENTILVGHSRIGIFGILHFLNIDDMIIFTKNNMRYKYLITEINVINEEEYTLINNKENNYKLTLITCMEDNSKRLVITCISIDRTLKQ